MPHPGAIVSLGLYGAAVVMILMGHYVAGYHYLLTFGPIVLALAITVSLIVAGLRHAILILIVFVALEVFFIGTNNFGWFGLQGFL